MSDSPPTPPGKLKDLQKAAAVDREGDAGGGALMMQGATGLKQKWSDSPPALTHCLSLKVSLRHIVTLTVGIQSFMHSD